MRKLLYTIYVPLLVIEWLVDLIGNIWKALHDAIKDITLSVETIIHEPISPKD